MPTFSIGVIWEVRPTGAPDNGGGFDPIYGGTDLSQQSSGVTRTDLVIGTVAAPAAPTLATGAGGSLSAGTYQVKLTYYNSNTDTETDPTAASSIVAAANDKITVTSPAASEGATHYRVYFTVAGGATFRFQTTVVVGTNYIQSTNPAAGNSPGATNYLQYYTSAGNPFTSADTGNIIKVTAGVNFTKTRVEARDFTSTSSRLYCVCVGSITLGTSGATGGTGTIGGALSNPTQLGREAALVSNTPAQPGNTVWVQAATYSQIHSFSNPWVPGSVDTTAALPVRWISYQTTRGDYGARAVIKSGATQNILDSSGGANYIIFDYFEIDGDDHNWTRGVSAGVGWVLINCYIHNCKGLGTSGSTTAVYLGCEIKSCSAAGSFTNEAACSDGIYIGCYIHSNTLPAVWGATVRLDSCIIADNTGGSTDGIYISSPNISASVIIKNCDIHNNGRHGINIVNAVTTVFQVNIINNLITSNAGMGLNANRYTGTSGNISVLPEVIPVWNNSFFDNTGGDYDADWEALDFRDNEVLASTPYVDSAGGDYRLNGDTGGGLNCIGTGYNVSFPSLPASVSYPDRGAVRTLGSPAGVGNTIAFVGGG